jgi:predicted ATPase/ATP/maltotriose-dependent transcriptional regulator MalT
MLDLRLPTYPVSFVGREEELRQITALLDDPACRLLTLLGPGGIGKTRLAIEASRLAQSSFAHRVYFVPLQPLNAIEFIVPRIVEALHLQFSPTSDLRQQLLAFLRQKSLLLILDNFEHLLDGADIISEILTSAPGVKILITSRERLNLLEEWMLALDGLRTPDGYPSAPVETYSAVQLFVQRARQAQANFSLNDNVEAVKLICQRIEGMPLGLELAASWLYAMSCQQIAEHVTVNLDFLITPLRNVPERHRSLRAIFEQSWRLLSPDEQAVLARLSIFRGGFQWQAAEQVAAASPPVLANLVDKSLLRLGAGGRYDLHEVLRQYAASMLTADETAATAARHLAYFLKLAEEIEMEGGGRQTAGYDRLETELDNLRAALAWSLQCEKDDHGLRCAASLSWFFNERSRAREGLRWLEQTFATAPNASPSLRAKALAGAAENAGRINEYSLSQQYAEQALAIARATNDRLNVALSLAALGYFGEKKQHPQRRTVLDESAALLRELPITIALADVLNRRAQIALWDGDAVKGRLLLEEALRVSSALNNNPIAASSLHIMGDFVWHLEHDMMQAVEWYEKSVSLYRSEHNRLMIVFPLNMLAVHALQTGNYAQAETYYRETLALLGRSSPNHLTINSMLMGMATIAIARGTLHRAVRLLSAAEIGVSSGFIASEIEAYTHHVAALRSELSQAVFDKAWTEGKSMSREQAIAYALEDNPTRPSPVGKTQPEQLSARELEVLRLIAEGLSNAEIAQNLVLSLNTVKVHTSNIFGKLGVSRRTQAVTEAQKLHLL